MKQTFGLLAGVSLFLCAASNTHADTVKAIGASSILDAQRTPSETTSVFFDAVSRPHTPSNPTTSTLIVPVAVGPLLNTDRQDDPDASVPTPGRLTGASRQCRRPTHAHHRQFERCLGACGARLSAATTRIRPFHTHFRKPITSRNTSVWDRSCWPFRAWSSSTEAVTGIGYQQETFAVQSSCPLYPQN